MRWLLRSRAPLLALVSTAMLMAPSLASASEASTIIYRCVNGKSLSGFKQAAYRKALKELAETGRQYSDCEELIRKAQLAAAGGLSSGGGGLPGAAQAVPLPVTPTEQHAIDSAGHTSPGSVAVGNKLVVPGVTHANIASVFSSLPAPLLALVIFVLACALGAAGQTLRERVLKRRGI
jgi:hypothetical protein